VCCYFRTENFESLEDLVRVVVREFPLVSANVGKHDTDIVCYALMITYAFSALTLLVGWQEGHPACKNMGGWWRWALVSPDRVAPSWMVCVSASVNLPLHHKVQKFSSGTGSPG